MHGWISCGFTSLSTVFQSYKDDGRVSMKGTLQWSAVYVRKESRLQQDSNPRPSDPKCLSWYTLFWAYPASRAGKGTWGGGGRRQWYLWNRPWQRFNDFPFQTWHIKPLLELVFQLHSSRVAVQFKSDFWTGCNVLLKKEIRKHLNVEEG